MIFKILQFIKSKIISIRIKVKYKSIGINSKFVQIREFNVPVGLVKIGNDFFAGAGLYISLSEYSYLDIGNAVMFGPEVMILGGNHNYKYAEGHLRYFSQADPLAKNILIEDGVWVGARAMFLSGGTAAEGAVIGANSLVNKYIPPYTIAVGSPIQVIGCRFNCKQELDEVLCNVNSKYKLEQLLSIYESHGIKLK